MLLQEGEQVFSQFQGTEAHCKRGLDVKKNRQALLYSLHPTSGASVPSQSGVYTASRKIQASCFVSFLRFLSRVYALASLCASLPSFGKEQLFIHKSSFSKKENTFSVGLRLLKSTAKT